MSKIIRNNLNSITVTTNNRTFQVEAFFIDLDGTLLDKWNKKVSQKNIEVIKEKQKTTPIVISTGRSYSTKVKKVMNLLNIKYAICQNGAVVVDSDGKFYQDITLNKGQIEKVVQIVKDNKLGFTINSEFLIYSNYWLWAPLRFLWFKKWKRISKYHPQDNKVNKIVVAGFIRSNSTWRIAKEIQKIVEGVSVKTSGRDKVIEITHETATKGEGAIFVSKLLGIDIKNTIHIGDSENDSTTLDKVGALVAVSDASTKLIDVATHLGPKHKRSGIAKILNGDFNEIKR